jgi:hypothetical protein
MPGNYDINLLCLPVEAGFLQKWPSADVCVRQVACPRVPSNAVSRVKAGGITPPYNLLRNGFALLTILITRFA